jgi:hypothetical protein
MGIKQNAHRHSRSTKQEPLQYLTSPYSTHHITRYDECTLLLLFCFMQTSHCYNNTISVLSGKYDVPLLPKGKLTIFNGKKTQHAEATVCCKSTAATRPRKSNLHRILLHLILLILSQDKRCFHLKLFAVCLRSLDSSHDCLHKT